jgi:hypothetical protein
MFSFTLQVKSDGYERSPSTRVFLCASSPDDSGRHALDWAIEGLVQDGDELIVFRGIDQDDLGLSIRLGCYRPSVIPSAEKDHDVVRDEARDLMHRIQDKCVEVDQDRKVSIVHCCECGRAIIYFFVSVIHHRRVHRRKGDNDDRSSHRALPPRLCCCWLTGFTEDETGVRRSFWSAKHGRRLEVLP